MATLLITHPAFLQHDTGAGHPERSDRMRAIDKVLAHEVFSSLVRAEAPIRDDAEEMIIKAHSKEHLEAMRAVAANRGAAQGSVRVDADTVVSPGTWEAALRAVGAGMLAVDKVMAGEAKNAFAQVRPPGHHAESDKAMGFCLFNNVAIAAHYARAKHGAKRIAVVDFDVHHGNGTQDIFWADTDLYYASTHEMPLYPGTGALNETGAGNIWNAPLRAGDAGDRFRDAVETRILPSIHNFAPDLLIISAGFDAHERDPLANLQLVESDFLWVTEALAKVAARHCNGRIVSMLEGGYDLNGLAKSVAVHVKTLMDVSG
jgi:acetoin utilization deacetylase AcuC-like enzyme